MYDLVIVGGGINGVGIARDAAGRGLKVLLCEKDDIAQHTSSASTKLIHGGLRYLEQYEFSLVRKALLEREVLLNIAPHIIWPLRFVLPHAPHLRPAWMIRAGMFLYDNLALRKKLPKSRFVNLQKHVAGQFIKSEFRKGFEYSDAFVYDARLSILNAMDAQERGADIRVQTRVVSATPNRGAWDVVIEPNGEGQQIIQAKVIVNASGPWVSNVLTDALKIASKNVVRHVKGSHIVVPAMFDHKFAYIFQNEDKRVIFAIPFERGFTLVGTTDIEYEDRLDQVKISDDEEAYLCDAVSRYFNTPVCPQDIVSSFAGVRPLLDDDSGNPSAVTRDYSLELSHCEQSPVISVFGGKITTYRVLAEEVLDKLSELMPIEKNAWTQNAALPGGDFSDGDFLSFEAKQQKLYHWLPTELISRYARLYGTRMNVFLSGKVCIADMGELISSDLYSAEVNYLMSNEWARTADDVLFRRSKLGLIASKEDVGRLVAYMDNARKVMIH